MDSSMYEKENATLLKKPSYASFASEHHQDYWRASSRPDSVLDGDFRLEPFNISPEAVPSLRDNQRSTSGWKSYTSKLYRKGHPTERRKKPLLLTIARSWLWELLACCGGLSTLGVLIWVLKSYDGRAQPEWPYNVTVNTLVSWIGSLMRASMTFVLAVCVSQSTWMDFQSRSSSLLNLTAYESASRGPTGAFQLFRCRKTSTILCTGAALMALTIGTEPTLQQIIAIGSEWVPSSTGTTIHRALSYDVSLPVSATEISKLDDAQLDVSLTAAIYNALFSNTVDQNSSALYLVASCPTDYCDFEPFQSLALCSSCFDFTNFLNKTCFVSPRDATVISYCQYFTPNGLKLNVTYSDKARVSASGYLEPMGDIEYATKVLTYSVISYNQSRQGSSANSLNALFTQCSLYWCVNTYKSQINGSELFETITASWYPPSENRTVSNISSLAPPKKSENDSSSVYHVSVAGSERLRAWLMEELTFIDDNEVVLNGLGNPKIDLDPKTNVSSYATCPESMLSVWLRDQLKEFEASTLISNLAIGITKEMRSKSLYLNVPESFPDLGSNVESVTGTAWDYDVVIRVKWPWLTFSCSLMALTILVLARTIAITAKLGLPTWKSSPFPLLVHALDEKDLDRLKSARGICEMEQLAGQINVQLKPSATGYRLESASGAEDRGN